MKRNCQYIRKANVIRKIGEGFQTFPSINAAKKFSRKLQQEVGNLGEGLVENQTLRTFKPSRQRPLFRNSTKKPRKTFIKSGINRNKRTEMQ